MQPKNLINVMPKEIRLKKGLRINLVGDADKVYASVKLMIGTITLLSQLIFMQ